MLREGSHPQKAANCIFHLNVQNLYMGTENRKISGFQGLEVRGGIDYLGNGRICGAVELLYTLIVVVVKFAKTHGTIH